jgi:hypothetical protein
MTRAGSDLNTWVLGRGDNAIAAQVLIHKRGVRQAGANDQDDDQVSTMLNALPQLQKKIRDASLSVVKVVGGVSWGS